MSDTTTPAVPLATPLYKEVKRQMMNGLTRGDWKPGEAIPSERKLSETYGISIGTVRKAIDELCAENILIRQQGRGTYVASHNRERMLFYFFHVVPDAGPKAYPDVKLVSFARGRADRAEAEHLAVSPGDAVVRIRNVLSLGGAPIIVDDIALPAARYPGLTERQFRTRPSTIYSLYQDAFGISVVKTSERLRAILADADAAGFLALEAGAPLLQIRRVAYTYRDDPVEYRVSRVNTAHHEYWADIGTTPA